LYYERILFIFFSLLFILFLAKGRFTRNTAATEIYTTEKTYVEQLTIIVEHFIIPTKEKKLISDSGLSLMFTELMSIQQLHVDFLSQMEQRIKNWSNASQLGDLFSKLVNTIIVHYHIIV